jgi:hypothetical protein
VRFGVVASSCCLVLGCHGVFGLNSVDVHVDADLGPACGAPPEPGAFASYELLFDTFTSASLDEAQTRMMLQGSNGEVLETSAQGTGFAVPTAVPVLRVHASEPPRPRLTYDGNHVYLHSQEGTFEATRGAAGWAMPTQVAIEEASGSAEPVTLGVPDRDHLRVIGWRRTMFRLYEYTIDSEGRLREVLGTLDALNDGQVVSAQLSPDGCWLVYGHTSDVGYEARIAGRPSRFAAFTSGRKLTDRLDASEFEPWLSPDGNTIYVRGPQMPSTTYATVARARRI